MLSRTTCYFFFFSFPSFISHSVAFIPFSHSHKSGTHNFTFLYYKLFKNFADLLTLRISQMHVFLNSKPKQSKQTKINTNEQTNCLKSLKSKDGSVCKI